MAREKQKEDFSATLQRLAVVVETLEKGGVSLEDAVKLYAEGANLVQSCQQALQQAEQRVQMLTQDGLKDVDVQDLGK